MNSQLTTAHHIWAAVAARYSGIGNTPSAEKTIPTGRHWTEQLGYPATLLDAVPSSALDSFTGIGAPLLYADLMPDERILDLGCGAGLDSILAARQVGPEGRVYGVDLAPGMLAAAHAAVSKAQLENVTLLGVPAEQLPLPDGSVDGAMANGLFNLVPDKALVAREVARVLRPGGRLLGAEIVLTDNRGPTEPDLEAWFR
jgi:arsenite methyltransferase